MELVENRNIALMSKLKGVVALFKLRLSIIVAFSGAMAFVLASDSISYFGLTIFSITALLVTGAANIVNQVKEIEYDKLMTRTKERPLPTSILSVKEAVIVCVISLLIGLTLQVVFLNALTAVLSLISFILYGFVYTPLKRKGPIAVFVGAIPGALPPLIGWAASQNSISYVALILFGIQFIWQFPHFWAIAWVAHEDYSRAGFKLLPGNGKQDMNTAFKIMMYTLYLIPVSLLPYFFGITGITSAIVVTILGLLFLTQTFYLMSRRDRKAALQMMFGSFIYLPIVQISFVLDKL